MTKRRKKPKLHKVKLPPANILHVALPKGHVPVVTVDPVTAVVEIVPVPEEKKRSFWQSLFGNN